MAEITYITVEELKSMIEHDDIHVYDIREQDEYNRDHIQNATNVPLSKFSPNNFSNLKQDSKAVFYCQSGNRTRQCESQLKNLSLKEVMILKGGVSEWKKCGCSIVANNKAPLPLMRQVQLIAGSLIMLGVILSLVVSPYFIFLSGFVGAGLFFAGATGFCGMANILLLLPYNKHKGQKVY